MRKKVLIVLMSMILLGSMATLALYNIGGFVLDTAIDNALASEEISSADTAQNTKQEPLSTAEQNTTDQQVPTVDSADDTLSEETNHSDASISETNHTEGNNSENSTNTPEPKAAQQSNAPIITEKQAEEIKENVSAKDKIAVSMMVISNLSTEDIQYLTGLLANGLTASEKAAAKSLCYKRFSHEDIEKIHSLYKKYNAS